MACEPMMCEYVRVNWRKKDLDGAAASPKRELGRDRLAGWYWGDARGSF